MFVNSLVGFGAQQQSPEVDLSQLLEAFLHPVEV